MTLVDKDDINQRIFINSEIAWNYGRLEEPQPEEALEYFEKAIELGREDAWIFEMKGIILLDLKRYEEALNYFKKAYAKNEDGLVLLHIFLSLVILFLSFQKSKHLLFLIL